MRKTLLCLTGLMLVFFFISCSSKNYESTTEKEKTKGTETAKEIKADSEKKMETTKEGIKKETKVEKTAMKTEKAPIAATSSTADDSDLTVEEAVIATGVENLTPIGAGTEFTKDTPKIYCYSKIVGAKNPTAIKHKWYYGGKEAAEINLNVGGSSWRTYSSKNIVPEFSGSWRVDITTKNDKVLKSLNFEIK